MPHQRQPGTAREARPAHLEQTSHLASVLYVWPLLTAPVPLMEACSGVPALHRSAVHDRQDIRNMHTSQMMCSGVLSPVLPPELCHSKVKETGSGPVFVWMQV